MSQKHFQKLLLNIFATRISKMFAPLPQKFRKIPKIFKGQGGDANQTFF